MKVRIAALGLVGTVLLGLSPMTALAGHTAPVITTSRMSLSLPGPTAAGQDFFIGARLTSAGSPVNQGLVYLFIDGAKRHEMRTDATGSVRFHRVGNIADGSYQVTVAYRGDHDPRHDIRPGPASASGTLVITAAGITLSLPPATPAGHKATMTAVLYTAGSPEPDAELLVSLNGSLHKRARTDSSGAAHIVLPTNLVAGQYTVTVRYLGHRRLHGEPAQATFASATGTLVILPEGIVLEMPTAAAPGQKLEFTAHLFSGGAAVPNTHLSLLVDGRFRRQERTDAAGVASFALLGNLPAGVHRFTVQYLAPHRRRSPANLVLASASSTIQIRPLVLKVQTVPPIAGVNFLVDGRSFASDATGLASTTVATAGFHDLTVSLHDPNPLTHLEFGRWGDDAFTADRQVRLQGDVSLTAGLRIAYLTQLHFVGGQNNRLDPGRVSDVILSGPNAESVSVTDPSKPVWLQTALPAKRSGADGLFYSPTPYTVTNAEYDGLSVVDRGSQPFLPGPSSWSMSLKLYTMRIHAEDALLGINVSKPASVTDEAGKSRVVHLDRHGNATLLVGRGNYTVHVAASGISPLAPVALSRDKEAIVPIISVLDLVIVGMGIGLTLVTLFLLGRRRRWLAALFLTRQARQFHGGYAS